MDGAARNFYSVFKCLFLSMKSFESREKRRVYVQDPVPVCLNNLASQEPEISRKQEEVRIILFKYLQDFPVVSGSVKPFRVKKNSMLQ